MRIIGVARILMFYGLMTVLSLAVVWQQHALSFLKIAAPQFAVGLGAGIILTFVARYTSLSFDSGRRFINELSSFVGPLSYLEATLLALASGLGEELLFRGVLQPALGLWITSAIFALLHVGPSGRFLLWTSFSLLAALLFGTLVNMTHNLWPAIIAHATVNLLNLLWLSRRAQSLGFD
jgi:uncharacterized protein